MWLWQHRWNIGVVRTAAMEHRCRCGPGPGWGCGGLRGGWGLRGAAGAGQARAEANLAAP